MKADDIRNPPTARVVATNEPDRWLVICEHGTTISIRGRESDAKMCAGWPRTWCPECVEWLQAASVVSEFLLQPWRKNLPTA